jgi:hypothetical protein
VTTRAAKRATQPKLRAFISDGEVEVLSAPMGTYVILEPMLVQLQSTQMPTFLYGGFHSQDRITGR